ncbi:PGAP1-like protein [Desulfomicrobium apsheronum]|uniref:PGAP1-like protein n=1 Tax=Desulfomicrobium apsheronum TaxID=52560 RepID=A0A1I4ACV3_9BACT|nr:alpha/beta fold hydrolase [Desulfomicrobium apsheronum]SFK53927.1 PGAP1-like protein [Desulfomicrobium apsheronum]
MISLENVHNVSDPDAIHVVFVHGLGGDTKSTWMHNPNDCTTLWPKWIGESAGCHVWITGYCSAISGWTDSAMHLVEQGEAFIAALQAEPNLQGRKLVLVGHSLGGLIIKSGMTQAQTLGDPRLLTVLDVIAGVVFIATPHQGANLATIANWLRLPLRTNHQVTNMVSDDPWLKVLNGQFQALHAQRRFGVRVFHETKGFFIGKRILGFAIGPRILIVDRNSSDPNIAGVVPTGIDADHIQISKPRSRQELVHKSLVEFLKNVGTPTAPPTADSRTFAKFVKPEELSSRLRNASVQLLNWPSTLPDGTWLQRSELDVLNANLSEEPKSTNFLLGDPGSGKSSILVRLAREKQDAGWEVLAIKADRLPSNLLDRESLARHLNLGTDTGEVLRTLAKSNSVLLVIDQVDALADLVVQQSARLRVLLDLVQDLADAQGVHTVISCRTFEQKHDPALRNLHATILTLELPEWPTVLRVLEARGLQAGGWNQDIQQVLRSPHALDIFLSLLEGATELEALRSFQGLLEKQWETHVLSDTSGRRRATLRHLAKLMADREVLGLPLAIVEDNYPEIQALVATGLLRLDQGPRRVEFRHQTLYEFVRARSFLEESGSLTETVRAQQASLRIRPQLWHALGYFRDASPEEYNTEIRKLWAAELRPHLKMLLIEFLGLQAKPLPAERQLIEQAMMDQWFLPRFIGASVGSPGWFTFFTQSHLHRLMTLPEEQPRVVLPLLKRALHFNPDAVIDLVQRHWLPDEARDSLSWQVLGCGDVAPSTGRWMDSLILIASRTSVPDWSIRHLTGVVCAALPNEAPKLVATWLKRQIDRAKASSSTPSDAVPSVASKVSDNIQSILEVRHFYDLEAIAEAAPKLFVLSIWPLLLEGLDLCASDPPAVVTGYRRSRGLLFQDLDDEEIRSEKPIFRAIQLGIQGWAESDLAGYLEFLAVNAQSDLLFVHRLLAMGLIRIVSHSPQSVLDYLLEDPRRLVLGPYNNMHKESISLIESVSPYLDKQSLDHLEATLRDWRFYNDTVQRDDAEIRLQRLKLDRQHRLRLLRALPEERRSSNLQKFIVEEERAFPDLSDRDIGFTGVQMIGSPMSAEQMARSTDSDILNLFNELTDETAWEHPKHSMSGGAIQAGRELAALAKLDLAKTIRIVKGLDPTRNEIPVTSALQELVPAGLAIPNFYSLVAELEDKGFVGIKFRNDAAYAIANVAQKGSPVPTELIDRMERWLITCVAETSIEANIDDTDQDTSILWGRGLMQALPKGNYPTLNALSALCLTSEPPRTDRWLDILERHAVQIESSRVWEAMLQHDLEYLRLANRSRAEFFLDKLVANMPSIVMGKAWVRFVARTYHWASNTAVKRWLMYTVDNNKTGLQGAGELACLRHAYFPAENWSRNLLQRLLDTDSSEVAQGIAHSVANLWHEPMTRPVVHHLLLQLLSSRDEKVLAALSNIFLKDGFASDEETREFLDTIVAYPNVLENDRAEHLAESLVNMVATEPKRVCQVAHTLLDIAGKKMSNIATSWYLSTESLLDIALQLQDMDASEKTAGSALFERMLEFNMPQAREMTFDLDKRTTATVPPRAPVRRKSRRR